MQVGSLGDVIFEASSTRLLAPNDVKLSWDVKFEDHEIQGAAPRSEFIAPGLGSCSFTLLLMSDLGVDPVTEYGKLITHLQSGDVLQLIIGGKNFGDWTLRKVDGTIKYMTNNVPVVMEVAVELKEYF